MWILLFLCLPYIYTVESSLVPFITKCTLNDEKCLKESTIKALPTFAEGIPELKVESLDPLKIKRVDATKPALAIIVTDIVVTGLKQCGVLDIKRDNDKENLSLKLLCTCLAVGKYDMNGQLLFISLKGNGDMITNINDILINVDVNYTTVNKGGKNYWHIKTWKYEYELKGKSQVKFENLFEGNEILQKSTNELIANNGNDVIKEMGTPIITAVVTKIVKTIASFLKALPVEDLAIL